MLYIQGDFRKKVNSFLIAIFVLEVQVCQIIADIVYVKNISVVLMMLISVTYLVNNRKLRYSKWAILTYLAIYVWLALSIIINGFQYVLEQLLFYTVFGTVAFLLITNEEMISFIKSLEYMCYISFVRAIFYIIFEMDNLRNLAQAIDNSTNWSYDSVQMKIAFEFMQIMILFLIVAVHFVRFNTSIVNIGITIFTILVSVKAIFIDCWTRGAVVGVIGACLVIFLWKRKKAGIGIIVALSLITIVYLNLKGILIAVNDFFLSRGITIRSINKTLILLSKGNVSNNRSDLYREAIHVFLREPILGNGVGYYEKIKGIYVHNILLQVMCELGLIGAIGIIVWGYQVFMVLWNKIDTEISIFGVAVYTMTYFTLLSSGDYWSTPIFWMSFFFIINHYKKIKPVFWELERNSYD